MEFHSPSQDIIWQCVPFSALSAQTLYDVLALRIKVFCVEQNCPYQDPDGQDNQCWHVLAHMNGELVATARILPPELSYPDACSIGRVACSETVRGQKVGQQLMRRAVDACEAYFPNHPIRIGAQRYLERFYSQFGFVTQGEPYLEDGIVHVTMEKLANSGR
ncbi:GNAT family N-acetyltransferase [Reinekea forsetii]|nr:GNAT family N-acetyltransferase [Reinekea forsetii]